MEENTKIRTFTDLNTWKEGNKLAILVYTVTKNFPKEEIFSLTNQLRRAVVSVTSNIAEGFGRETSKDKTRFYYIAHGSLSEVESQLILSRDLNYLNNEEFEKLEQQIRLVSKLCNGLIKSIRS